MIWIEPDWPVPTTIHAVTTLRDGGISQPPYATLNLAAHVGDRPEHVAENRHIIRQELQLPTEPFWLHQVHSAIAVPATADSSITQVTGDASFSRQAGIVCAVMTADCLPILLADEQGETIAAIHAGWRGLAAGIIDNTFKQLPADHRYLAWLGPAIGPDCFEVGDDVRVAFVQRDSAFESAFKKQRCGKWLADIYQLARINLRKFKVDQIYGGDRCTVSEPDCFFSYRRDGQTGRMATLIWRD